MIIKKTVLLSYIKQILPNWYCRNSVDAGKENLCVDFPARVNKTFLFGAVIVTVTMPLLKLGHLEKSISITTSELKFVLDTDSC